MRVPADVPILRRRRTLRRCGQWGPPPWLGQSSPWPYLRKSARRHESTSLSHLSAGAAAPHSRLRAVAPSLRSRLGVSRGT